ncbi:DNA-directed RNA polymerase subunit beta [Striga asiatica]|uniref:DNA-directed RNA polymerase subunit beta n=1 Tax=Striga asiatica TaxID=4170 RepID=A0A5A7P451_STRAF|nr:DNA-directed RNA polymerase subunit beta [Striga asiatica]
MGTNFIFPKGSRVLNAIGRGWSPLMRGIRWSLGNGNKARFWRGKWCHLPTPLYLLAMGTIPEDQWELPVARFVTDDGAWNWTSSARLGGKHYLVSLFGKYGVAQKRHYLRIKNL